MLLEPAVYALCQLSYNPLPGADRTRTCNHALPRR